MKKFCAIAISIVLCIVLAGCQGGSSLAPRGAKTLDKSDIETVNVYVYGAVEREGFYVVDVGTDCLTVALNAGMVTDGIVADSYTVVTKSLDRICVCYVEDDKVVSPVNVNNLRAVATLLGDESDEYAKIADYVATNGNITNKTVLKDILGSSYNDCYYKLYVARSDYEDAC